MAFGCRSLVKVLKNIVKDPEVSVLKKEEMVEPLIALLGTDFEVIKVLRAIFNALGTSNLTKETITEAFCDYYLQFTDTWDRKTILAVIVPMVRGDENLKGILAEKLGLSGIQLDIWNDLGIMAISGDDDFTSSQLSAIYSGLNSLPLELIGCVDIIMAGACPLPAGMVWMFRGFDETIFIDIPGSGYLFQSALFNEIAPIIYYNVLTEEQRKEFDGLWAASGDNPENYACYEGTTPRRRDDFADMFADYTTDTIGILSRAKTQAEDDDDTNDILLEKVKFMAQLFAHEGEDGEMYTYIYEVESDGTLRRAEVELGQDSLPIIPDVIEWETF